MLKRYFNNIDKFGTFGMFLTAILSPCCFPLFAFVASTFGLGSIELFGSWTFWIFLITILITVIGLYLSYKKHRNFYPLLLAIPSSVLTLAIYYFIGNSGWLYVGMFGIILSTIWNYKQNKKQEICCTLCSTQADKDIELHSTITCPICKHSKEEIMPTDSCLFFYTCEKCNARIKPLPGDCCVFCSYGTMKCPSIQLKKGCC